MGGGNGLGGRGITIKTVIPKPFFLWYHFNVFHRVLVASRVPHPPIKGVIIRRWDKGTSSAEVIKL